MDLQQAYKEDGGKKKCGETAERKKLPTFSKTKKRWVISTKRKGAVWGENKIAIFQKMGLLKKNTPPPKKKKEK